jgi:predicted nucleic acid-binding protein
LTRAVEGRDDLIVSSLAITEIVSVLARRVRQHTLRSDAARGVYETVLTSLDAAPYVRVELSSETHRRAEHLLLTLTAAPLRAADALHLALAISARAASMATCDTRLAAAARAAGLTVYPS